MKPKLRPLQAFPYASAGEQLVCLRDPSGLSNKTAVLPPRAFFIAALCDGQHSVEEIQVEYGRNFGDVITIENIQSVITQLDNALFMEGPRIAEHRRAQVEDYMKRPARPAAFAGAAYPAAPEKLRAFIDSFFTAPGGPGAITDFVPDAGAVGFISPHIDILRGGNSYAHAYRNLAEKCPAETFIILGVAHAPCDACYVATDKDFTTPLGAVRCNGEFARDLIRRAGLKRGEDELLHKSEHSIEFQTVFLRHVRAAHRPARVVPVLVGNLMEAVGNADPASSGPVRDFVGALNEIMAEQDGACAIIAAADLSHVGRKFGDATDLTPAVLEWVETEDRALLAHVERGDAAAFFEHNRRDGDRRHVCGFGAIYTMLASLPNTRGRLLRYQQAPEPETQSVVSFAAMDLKISTGKGATAVINSC